MRCWLFSCKNNKFEQVGTKGCTCATTISHYLDQRAPPNVFLEKWKQQKVRRVMVGREGMYVCHIYEMSSLTKLMLMVVLAVAEKRKP